MLLSLILIWKLLTQKSRKLQSRLNFIAEKQGYMQPLIVTSPPSYHFSYLYWVAGTLFKSFVFKRSL